MDRNGSSGWRKGLLAGLALLAVLAGSLFYGPFAFDEGPLWHASVVGTRDAVQDVLDRTPHVLVIGDPSAASNQAQELEAQLARQGMRVRYTGDGRMTDWERKYVAVYWSIVGMFFEPPTG